MFIGSYILADWQNQLVNSRCVYTLKNTDFKAIMSNLAKLFREILGMTKKPTQDK